MKLLQLNVWGARLEKQIADLLKTELPDIACLQEAVDIPGDSTGGFFLPIREMATIMQSKNQFISPVVSYSFMNRTASFGNAILSKYTFTETQTIFTNAQFMEGFDFENDDYNIRNLQHAKLEIGGKALHILNHHGHHVPNHKNGNEDTLRQMKQIGEYIDKLEGAIILTGDFNLAPHSESLELLNDRLANLSISYGLTTTRTNLTHKTEVCDYIFVSDAVQVKNFHASDEIVSDHKALVLEFDV